MPQLVPQRPDQVPASQPLSHQLTPSLLQDTRLPSQQATPLISGLRGPMLPQPCVQAGWQSSRAAACWPRNAQQPLAAGLVECATCSGPPRSTANVQQYHPGAAAELTATGSELRGAPGHASSYTSICGRVGQASHPGQRQQHPHGSSSGGCTTAPGTQVGPACL